MKTLSSILARFTLVACVVVPVLQCSTFAQDTPSPFTVGDESHRAHILPTQREALKRNVVPGAALASAALTFHGGPVMSDVQTFAIFWVPVKLQNNTPTSISSSYRWVQESLLYGYAGHGIGNNNTQYNSTCFEPPSFNGLPDDFECFYFYQVNTGKASYYVQNLGGFMGSYVDKNPYPAGGCINPDTGANCISDADLQAEIKLDLTFLKAKGWTGGRNQMILVYTSSGEGSCFGDGKTNAGDACAYKAPPVPNGGGYCGYHSYFTVNGHTAIIYSNEPYTGHLGATLPARTRQRGPRTAIPRQMPLLA